MKSLVRSIPGYPIPSVNFRDITTLLADPCGFRETIDRIAERYTEARIAKVAGIEARGFILGGAVAYLLGAGFVPIRKKGKLPWTTIGHDYMLEYGTDRVEMHTDAIAAGERVLLLDDLVATGGTASAAAQLIDQTGGDLVELCFIIDLPDLGGRKKLEAEGRKVFHLMEFEGD
ncbi:MAG: adenine phosphoribosyltransferase [Gemmatimonadaceae bacterium]|nr:adenine phosphoribosyltransferase [Gemmatimonadaceae bacterium]